MARSNLALPGLLVLVIAPVNVNKTVPDGSDNGAERTSRLNKRYDRKTTNVRKREFIVTLLNVGICRVTFGICLSPIPDRVTSTSMSFMERTRTVESWPG